MSKLLLCLNVHSGALSSHITGPQKRLGEGFLNAIIGIGIELPLSQLELKWNCLYRNWNWSGIAFIRIGIGIELPLGLGTGFGIGVELPLLELELELNCKNGIDPSSAFVYNKSISKKM